MQAIAGAGDARGEIRRSRAREINSANHRPVAVQYVGHVHSAFAARLGGDAALLRNSLGFDAGVGIQILQLRQAVRGGRHQLDRTVRVVIHLVETETAFIDGAGVGKPVCFRDITIVVSDIPVAAERDDGVMVVVENIHRWIWQHRPRRNKSVRRIGIGLTVNHHAGRRRRGICEIIDPVSPVHMARLEKIRGERRRRRAADAGEIGAEPDDARVGWRAAAKI